MQGLLLCAGLCSFVVALQSPHKLTEALLTRKQGAHRHEHNTHAAPGRSKLKPCCEVQEAEAEAKAATTPATPEDCDDAAGLLKLAQERVDRAKMYGRETTIRCA